MYTNILIATDGSELAQKAVGQGIALARALNAKVTAVTVTEPWSAIVSGDGMIAFPVDDYDRSMAENAQSTLNGVAEVARKAAYPCASRHIKDQQPAEGIVEAAKSLGCDLIVMASHGRRGIARMLLGSQANKVVTLSPVPVLICR